jgi:4-hydroxy-2-oxoheptanedioate aldolase
MYLNKSLLKLKKLGATSLKQSFEDEGSSFVDIENLKKITKKVKLNLNVKIGGCEAKNDINFCISNDVNGIIAPMVESKYALRKFIQTIQKKTKTKLYINIETITAVKNIKKILNCVEAKKLYGVVFGRSDIAGSMNLKKRDVDSKKINNLLITAMKYAKSKNYKVKMGGSVTKKSYSFILNLYNKKILDFYETRNIEIKINKSNLKRYYEIINEIFKFEIQLIQYKKTINNNKLTLSFLRSRSLELNKRIKNKN